MGDFSLACLLGQYDKAQSFDVASSDPLTQVESWAKADQTSWYFTGSQGATYVHSSGQSLEIEVYSRSGSVGLAEYAYGTADDVRARWFSDVDTHTIEAAAWILLDPITSSGDLEFQLQAMPDVALPLAGLTMGSDPLAFHQLTTTVYSDGTADPRVGIYIPTGSNVNSQATVLIDDVLTVVDPLVLYPEWSFQERAQLIRSQHRAQSGNLHTLVWEKYFAYDIPLRFLTNSDAALVNWWWESQFNLVFTLDTSDSESRYIVRIVNGSQPVGRRSRPYENLWQGRLRLESINPGTLAF